MTVNPLLCGAFFDLRTNPMLVLKKIPTYSICNLLGSDQCFTEFLITRIGDFMRGHEDLYFPHRHAFFQIVLFTEGSGTHSIDFQKFQVVPHQVYAMGPGQIHSWEFDPGTEGFIINFNESFFTAICHNPNFVSEFPLFNAVSGVPVNILEAECCGEVHALMERMLREFQTDADFKQEMLRGMLLQIMVMLSRQLPRVSSFGISRHQLTTLRTFERLIEEHFREKRLPRDYAELLFITPNHLNALVNASIGKPAGELIRDRVVLEAKRLLANSDLNISQVAAALNFEDNAYFTRFFKKYTGVAPEVFRQEYAKSGVGERV
jgi:AraC family transcriptional regulator, transcriptional activator of pobA